MKNVQKKKQQSHGRRKQRVRAKVQGTAQRPRMSVHRSLSHVRVQLIDDEAGKTIASCSDTQVTADAASDLTKKCAQSYAVGKEIAERAKKNGITHIVFDRGGRKYHGRVQAVAQGARDAGLQF